MKDLPNDVKKALREKGYELIGYIGEGEFGKVWESKKDGKLYALKQKKVPKETIISENKNATFEVIIKTENVRVGETYYIYIVAFGEDGWKAWARIEVKIWAVS